MQRHHSKTSFIWHWESQHSKCVQHAWDACVKIVYRIDETCALTCNLFPRRAIMLAMQLKQSIWAIILANSVFILYMPLRMVGPRAFPIAYSLTSAPVWISAFWTDCDCNVCLYERAFWLQTGWETCYYLLEARSLGNQMVGKILARWSFTEGCRHSRHLDF